MLKKITALFSLPRHLAALRGVFIWAVLITPLNAQEPQEITLFLPVSAAQLSPLTSELKSGLNKAGLTNIDIVVPSFWQQYQQHIRHGQIGIYYAAPHFAAWLIHRHGFRPLLRNEEPLQFIIASDANRSNIFEIRDLQQQPICTQSALNLDYLLINNVFAKSLSPANAHIVPLVSTQMKKSEPPCAAFSINQHAFLKQQSKQSNRFMRLAQGETTSNYTFLVPPSYSQQSADRLSLFLQENNTLNALKPLLDLHSTKTSLVSAKKSDYPAAYIHELKKYWREKPETNTLQEKPLTD